jgi:DNA-directed RNA polymerase subunit RPC12/RpoP
MIVHAELSCMNCGYEMGDVEGQKGAPVKELVFLPMHQGDTLQVDGRGRFRCPRCQGRVLPHGVTPVRRPMDRTSLHEARINGTVTRGLMY